MRKKILLLCRVFLFLLCVKPAMAVDTVTLTTYYPSPIGRYSNMTISNNLTVETGNLGVRTASPSYVLHVNGSVAGVGVYNNVSDERLKKDIVTLENGLSSIEKLRGVRFHWRSIEEREVGKDRNLPEMDPQIGFIAQEVESVFPELVTTAGDGIKSVQQAGVVPVLVEAVKDLKAQVDALQKRVDALEAAK